MLTLRIEHLGKKYEGNILLEDISFHVNSGEVLCLLGRSGSGKSTILRIIAGIENQDAGEVFWDDVQIDSVPVHLRNFSLMFQDYALFPHMNVFENVAFGLRMKGINREKIKNDVMNSLEQVNMSGFAYRQVTDLSGGEQQRVALARALAPNPRMLMLDEPLAALDRTLRVELQEELRTQLVHTGIPTIYVTHDQEEAIVVSDRLALLKDGKIIQFDQTEQVFRHPVNRWAAEFLGMSNFIEGKVKSLYPFMVQTKEGNFSPSINGCSLDWSIGDKKVMLLKPSGRIISPSDAQVNTIKAEVTKSMFRGDHYRLQLVTKTGFSFEIISAYTCCVHQEVLVQFLADEIVCLGN